MKRVIYQLLLLFCCHSMAYAQISISGVSLNEPEEQIRENFALSNMYLHSIEIQGNNENIGIFTHGSNNIRQFKGIVLSTGAVNEAAGNASDLLSFDQNTPGFAAFDDLYDAGSTFDATYLRVIFTPFGDKVQLPFVLASENYDNNICEINNDWLGIFVRPEDEWGSSNWENLATVPGKPNVPVTPNTINRSSDVEDPTECARLDSTWNWNDSYFNRQASGIKYNGATANILTRIKTVIPGNRYELIIVIADGYDPYYDSAVFIPGFNYQNAKPYVTVRSSHRKCVGQPLQIGDRTITEAGVHIVKLTGEDAPIDTFQIASVSFYYPERNDTHYICPGESVEIGDTTLTEPVLDFPDTLELDEQCHMIVYHDIFYKGGNRIERYHELCQGEVLTIGNQAFTTNGYYEETILNPGSCNELILHHFQFSETIEREEVFNACAGDTVIIEGIPYTSDASFARTYTAVGGCDSIVQYKIQFDTPIHKIVDKVRGAERGIPYDTLFLADTFFVRNAIYFEYKEALEGCDTIVEYRINIKSLEVAFEESLDTNYCVGEEISLILGQDYFIKKGYRDWSTSVKDSIIGTPNSHLSSTINIDTYPAEAQIENVQDLSFVSISIDHDRITDLDVTITCPSGKTALLTKRSESNHPIRLSTDSSSAVFWTPYHMLTWQEYGLQASRTLYPGLEFRTSDDLNQLVGCPLNGKWKMEVKDYWATTNGYWWNWSIAFPDDEATFRKEETISWSWYVTEGNQDQIEIENMGSFSTYGFPDAKMKASNTGQYAVSNTTFVTTNFYFVGSRFDFSVTNEYTGPVESLDTILCTPTILYDSLITQSGTYELIKEHSDYCNGIPIVVDVTAITPDTTFLSTTTCEFSDSDLNIETLSNQYGCDSLIFTGIQLVVDTLFSQNIMCFPGITTINRTFETLEVVVDDGCDYVSVEEILSAPIDTTFLITPSCQLRDSLPTVEVLDNQYGCDSVIITAFDLRFDTLTHIINTCTTGIATPQQLIDTEWIINEETCDTFQVTITNLLPLDTTLVTTASCNPQDTGTFFQIVPNQYLCDSLVITQVEFDPDTLYMETNTCYPQDSGWHLQVHEQTDGCQFLEWTYRRYVPLEYEWLITADTCSFGQGSATFVPANTNLEYTFEWDGPAVNVDPAELFRGVYNVTITATGDTYPEACVDTSRVIIGSISALPLVSFTYEALDLDYQFTSEIVEADTFYWDFGDGSTAAEANPTHTFAQTGTYAVCLVAKNGCGTQQDCQAVVTIKDYPIAGKVETAPNFPTTSGINRVQMRLSSDQVALDTISDQDGNFSFSKQFEGYDYSLWPEKEEDILNGLDVSDILKIAQAANGNRQLDTPYELLAADVDCDASITAADALYLNQLLLGQQQQFPNNCTSWVFWPQSYVFPTPEQPFDLPSSVSLNSLQEESLDNDFYGLKRGDLGGNADAGRSPTDLDTLFLQLENGIVEAGDTLQLDFRVHNFSELVGVQFEFVFDTFALVFHNLALGDLEALHMEHFGTTALDQGILRLIWVDLLGQTHSLADNEILFSLQLIAKQKISDRRSKMEVSTRELTASYFNEALEEGVVQLRMDDLVAISNVSNEVFQLGQNRPNPFQQTTIIPFQLSTSAPVSLKVHSQLGQLIWQQEGRFPAGKSEIEVNIPRAGVYYYSIDTPWGKATRKMVMVK